jgi:hypothetical protein
VQYVFDTVMSFFELMVLLIVGGRRERRGNWISAPKIKASTRR